jgi:hypothetical protein
LESLFVFDSGLEVEMDEEEVKEDVKEDVKEEEPIQVDKKEGGEVCKAKIDGIDYFG